MGDMRTDDFTSAQRIEDYTPFQLVDYIAVVRQQPIDKDSQVFLKNFERAIAFDNRDLLKLSLLNWKVLPSESKTNLSSFLPLIAKLSESV
jgi:hypothetical protein